MKRKKEEVKRKKRKDYMSTSKRVEPTLKEWKDLYRAAVNFRDLECWEWMYDGDVFGVQNPDTGEIGYCCVLGNQGEVFSLNVYLGEKGLKGYLQIANQAQQVDKMDLFHLQDCLMASFENRGELNTKDLNIINKLNLTFRGKNQWPLFRRLRPGFFPWYLTREEAQFLTVALQQAKNVALKVKKNNEMLIPVEHDLYYVMVPEKKEDKFKWKGNWIRIELEPDTLQIPALNDFYVNRIKKDSTAKGGGWEIDYFYHPSAVQDKKGEVPYYPLVCLFVERSRGLIIGFHMTAETDYLKEFLDKFLSLIENNKTIPSKIFIKKEQLYHVFTEIAEQLGIKLELVNKFKYLE